MHFRYRSGRDVYLSGILLTPIYEQITYLNSVVMPDDDAEEEEDEEDDEDASEEEK